MGEIYFPKSRKLHLEASKASQPHSESSSESDDEGAAEKEDRTKETARTSGEFTQFEPHFKVGDRVSIDDVQSHMWGGGLITNVVAPGARGNPLMSHERFRRA